MFLPDKKHFLFLDLDNDELGTAKVIATIPSRDKNSPCYYHSFGITKVRKSDKKVSLG
jgi:hypothetical protein